MPPVAVTLPPEPGQIVRARQRPFVVVDVRASALPATVATNGPDLLAPPPQHLVTLSSVEDDALGEELQVIWELEPGAVAREKSSLPEVIGFDRPERLDAFLDAVRWGAVSSADDRALQAPFRSGIEVEEYQLDPLVRALSMPRVNLLIADDVGLGKTIETGLVVQELILRYRARSVIIVCPASIQVQWQSEMQEKFGLDFRIVDSEGLAELRRRRGLHVNPWTHFPRLITSLDFLKRERPLRLFRDTLRAEAYPRRFDLLIVDEAHNVAPSGRGKYATDSLRTQAIQTLVPHFEHKLFLSATPHNGYPESFTALLELLDDQRFARGVQPNRTQLEAVMVRRMKSELERRWDNSRRFARREVHAIEVPYTDDERRAHRALRRYADLRQAHAEGASERLANEFVLKLLKKRLFSSPAAFATTLERHARTVLAAQRAEAVLAPRALAQQLDFAEEDFADDETYEQAADDALDAAGRAVRPADGEERALLEELRAFAAGATRTADAKARTLLDWLAANLKPGGVWNRERVILFTEYRATQRWLQDLLATHGYAGGGRLLTIYGGLARDQREKIKAAFQADPDDSPVRILLATDAASEGLNLQNHCSRLIHYEIPWNPNRLEQRNGRVDRHGQRAAAVHIHHFVAKGFQSSRAALAPGDLDADLEFLMRAALKIESIREDLLGKVGTVIADQVEEAMLGRRARPMDTTRAEQEAEPVRRLLRFERQLQAQLRRLADQLHETRRDLHLTPTSVENVVQAALELAGQPPLIPVEVLGHAPGQTARAWQLPAFHTPAWRECLAGLEHPHTRVVRPVTFDQGLANGRDDLVLAHLNHRLVAMCLRLLRAEVWSGGEAETRTDDAPARSGSRLHRVTACVATDGALAHPVILAHGRLVVLGADSQRLHEEIILAGGTIREGRFSRLNVTDARAAHDAALSEAAPGFIEDRLRDLWPRLRDPLLQSLEARVAERTKNLQSFLDERSEREVEKLTTILNELAAAISDELQTEADPQLRLLLDNDTERAQRERDIASLRARLDRIPAEIERETAHLRVRYRDPRPRLFPVAVTFVLPRRAVADLMR